MAVLTVRCRVCRSSASGHLWFCFRAHRPDPHFWSRISQCKNQVGIFAFFSGGQTTKRARRLPFEPRHRL